MIRDFFLSIRYYIEGIAAVRRYSLLHLLWIPIILSGVIGLGVIYFSYSFSDELGAWLTGWYDFEQGVEIVRMIGQIISGVLLLIMGVFVFRYLILILLSPFLSYLSQSLNNKLIDDTSQRHLANFNFIQGMLRGVRMALTYGLRELLLLSLLFFFSFIPIIGWFSPFLIILVEAYYIGVGNIDFALEHYFNYKESNRFIRKKKGMVLGNGIIGMILLLIPLVGMLLVPVLGVIAATLAVNQAVEA